MDQTKRSTKTESWLKKNPWYQKRFLPEYREKKKKYDKEWYLKNSNKKKEYRDKYREKRCQWAIKRASDNRKYWYEILEMYGYNKCSKCGYDRYIGAIDLHHTSPKVNTGDKEIHLHIKPTKERLIEILEKCIPLCSNCHREVHHRPD